MNSTAVQLSLHIVNSTAGSIRVGPVIGLIHFLNATINLILHLCSVHISQNHNYYFCDENQEQDEDKRGQPTAALPDCSTAADQADDEEQGPYSHDHHGREERVHILKEVVIVVVSDEDIGSHVAEDASRPPEDEVEEDQHGLRGGDAALAHGADGRRRPGWASGAALTERGGNGAGGSAENCWA